VSDELKSAYELAMERLRKKDAAAGKAPPRKLTPEQKERIAAIRQEYQAKLAEREILHDAQRAAAMGDPEALERLERDYLRDREFLESQRDGQIRDIHGAENS
jgi:hypothetical protein